ncbi:orotidine-5'-phosphate decarboxylase [bacterium]|nr:orotidine-5'-phosphate decarboxylase [bacterium]
MNVQGFFKKLKKKKTELCVGLDTDVNKLPDHLPKNAEGFLQFNKEIIEATSEFAVSYKINTAFYESMGKVGWDLLFKTREMLPSNTFNIADAKRGDIGNTSSMYAKAFFKEMDFDALTVAPYMGEDSIAPFLEYKDKVTIVLGLTSNKGSANFQTHPEYNPPLYQTVLSTVKDWGNPDQLMFVIGATKAEKLKEIRGIIPEHFLLVPGVGAQGGSATEVCKHGLNSSGGLLINSSRGIIYASAGKDFAQKAADAAAELSSEMAPYVNKVLP